jgi:hypothetical protein
MTMVARRPKKPALIKAAGERPLKKRKVKCATNSDIEKWERNVKRNPLDSA